MESLVLLGLMGVGYLMTKTINIKHIMKQHLQYLKDLIIVFMI